MFSKSATRKTFVAAAALSAAIGLSACSSNGTDTAQAADTSSSSSQISVPKPAAVVRAIPGGTTAVTLDKGFTDALTQLGLTPGTVGTATLDGATGTVTFPISGGTVTLYDRETGYRPWVQGVLFHDGAGLSLTAGGTVVELRDFTIDPGKPARLFGSVLLNGQEVVPNAPLFDLDGSTLKPPTMDADGSAVLDGTTVKLSEEAAALLNETFKTDALAGGFVIGTSTITVQTS